jgi:hypothetical protein
MVSIIILAIAILPMAGMFEMGLNSATKSGNYDKARALANLKLEQAKSLPFDSDDNNIQDLKDDFPLPAGTPTTYFGGKYESAPAAQVGFPGFEYIVEKQYMVPPPTDSDADPADPAGEPWSPDTSNTPTDLIRVTVTVQWGDGNSYTTFGLVAQ